jgi:hypothetical protein
MNLEIYETKITEDVSGTIVALAVADGPMNSLERTFWIELSAILPAYKAPYLIHLQREALLVASEALSQMAESLLKELPRGQNARPELKK